jgi:hypothetical protein
MIVEEYIKSVLMQIDAGVSSAAQAGSQNQFVLAKGGAVRFDLAVVNRSDKRGKLRLEVLALGMRAGSKITEEHISRVSFEVTYRPKASLS